MFETVASGFKHAKNFLQNQRELTEKNISEALRKVRLSLLEADVEYSVVKNFLNKVKNKSLNKKVIVSTKIKNQKIRLSPSEHFIGICFEELKSLMGPVDTSILISKQHITSVIIVGLQGSGKTTTTAKLGLFLKKKQHNVLFVAADNYRPAAIEQLEIFGKKLNIPVFSNPTVSPIELCKLATSKAYELKCDIILFDTAGRLAIDKNLMLELKQIKKTTKSNNILLVVDSMSGQDVVRTASKFNEELNLDGFILTKLDGDSRGGAALSIKEVTQKPIKFLGLGEKLENLEEFRPDGLASRILGMGDVVGLIKDFEKHIDQKKAEKNAEYMLKGKFTLQNFLEQIKTIKKIGPLEDLIEKIPGFKNIIPTNKQINNYDFEKFESILLSMTKDERNNPKLIEKQKSRIKRIAIGSGREEKDVHNLIKRFNIMQQMMKTTGNQSNILNKIPGFKQIGQMVKIAKAHSSNSNDKIIENIFPNISNNSLDNIIEKKRINTYSKISAKIRKIKRKKAKNARKKIKKKK